MKSQTYQLFMKNMENELIRLEEMEQPTSNGKYFFLINIITVDKYSLHIYIMHFYETTEI